MSTLFPGPIPPYSNPPIHPEFYKPSRFVISDITRGVTTIVTTSVDHNYVIGQEIRLIIPPEYGIRQLNEETSNVISLPATNQVEINIDSRFMDAFIASVFPTKAQILAIGDINSGQINANGRIMNLTYIPGSFQNISPQ